MFPSCYLRDAICAGGTRPTYWTLQDSPAPCQNNGLRGSFFHGLDPHTENVIPVCKSLDWQIICLGYCFNHPNDDAIRCGTQVT